MADRREQLLAAFDKVESPDDEADEQTEGSVVKPAEDAPEASVPETDSADEPVAPKEEAAAPKKVEKKDSAERPGIPPKDTKKSKIAEPPTSKAPVPDVIEKPPTGVKRATRENWAKLDPDVRKEITERETEIAAAHAAIQKTRAWENEFRETVNPYLGLIQAQNSTPMRAVKNLMNTAARLSLGTATQKAGVIAEIISSYGVDLRELNSVLERQAQNPGAAPVQEAPPAWAQPIFQFMRGAQESQQAYKQRIEAEANRELEEISQKPYWDELKEDVGFLMRRASERKQILTLADAYTQARRMNPEIDAKLKAAEAGPGNDQASVLARAKQAASSVKGIPVGAAGKKTNGGTPTGPRSRRDLLRERFDELSGD